MLLAFTMNTTDRIEMTILMSTMTVLLMVTRDNLIGYLRVNQTLWGLAMIMLASCITAEMHSLVMAQTRSKLRTQLSQWVMHMSLVLRTLPRLMHFTTVVSYFACDCESQMTRFVQMTLSCMFS